MFPHASKTALDSSSKIYDNVPFWRVLRYNGIDRCKYVHRCRWVTPTCFCSERTCLVYLQENAAKFRFLATNRRQLWAVRNFIWDVLDDDFTKRIKSLPQCNFSFFCIFGFFYILWAFKYQVIPVFASWPIWKHKFFATAILCVRQKNAVADFVISRISWKRDLIGEGLFIYWYFDAFPVFRRT